MSWTQRSIAAAFAWVLCALPAWAQPFRGAGDAGANDAKGSKNARSSPRDRAIAKARIAALEAALAEVAGPVDRAARRAVLRSSSGWTAAYRIIAERTDGDVAHVELEVEIDLQRLNKRVRRGAPTTRPGYQLGQVVAKGCGEHEHAFTAELGVLGVVAGNTDGTPVDFELSCSPIGLVEHTFITVTRVEVRASARGRSLGTIRTHGFGGDPTAALAGGVAIAASDAASLLRAQTGGLTVRVANPWPSARIRRLQRVIVDSVVGVSSVTVAGLGADGSVLLAVKGDLSIKGLASALEGLSLPGFSLTLEDVSSAYGIAIRLQ